MKRGQLIHSVAIIGFLLLAMLGFSQQKPAEKGWLLFAVLCLAAAFAAMLRSRRARSAARIASDEPCSPEQMIDFPEGQARLIDSGRLPNRYHPHLAMHEFEICHFYAPAKRLLFLPPPTATDNRWQRFLIRCSGGHYYFIRQPGELLMFANPDKEIPGELVITSQRLIFLAQEDAFEVPLQRLTRLDCSARLVDFEIRSRRYTLYCDATCYAEKVLLLLKNKAE